ncbi:MAG: hypothetical protein JG781_2214 [Peptococcaceae bacterium]|jgi:hypothetical protein|nr:hypothetical protein [Peptococcaceae bacterium]
MNAPILANIEEALEKLAALEETRETLKKTPCSSWGE